MEKVINNIVVSFIKTTESKWKDGEAIEWYFDPIEHDNEMRRVLQKELSPIFDKYNELLLAVVNKYPQETRHETALRLIKLSQDSQCQISSFRCSDHGQVMPKPSCPKCKV